MGTRACLLAMPCWPGLIARLKQLPRMLTIHTLILKDIDSLKSMHNAGTCICIRHFNGRNLVLTRGPNSNDLLYANN